MPKRMPVCIGAEQPFGRASAHSAAQSGCPISFPVCPEMKTLDIGCFAVLHNAVSSAPVNPVSFLHVLYTRAQNKAVCSQAVKSHSQIRHSGIFPVNNQIQKPRIRQIGTPNKMISARNMEYWPVSCFVSAYV